MFAITVTLIFAFISAVVTIASPKMMMFWKLVALLAAVLVIFLFVRRDTYLPFLGPTAIPPSLIKEPVSPANANIYISLDFDVPDGTKVIYWGAKPSKVTLPNPWEAYDNYGNAGVAVVKDKKAHMSFFCPAKYRIPGGVKMSRHIHYRVCYQDGLVGPVETKYVDC